MYLDTILSWGPRLRRPRRNPLRDIVTMMFIKYKRIAANSVSDAVNVVPTTGRSISQESKNLMKNLDDMSPTQKKRTHISPRFIVSMLVLLLALIAVVSLGIFSTQGHNVALSAARSTPIQDSITPTVQATPAPASVKVYVTLDEYKITSSMTNFKVGTTYFFIVKNIGDTLHEFFIMPDKPNGSNYLVNGQYEGNAVQGQEIKPGATLMVNYIFKTSATTHYEIACLMRGHYAAGMSRPIVVK